MLSSSLILCALLSPLLGPHQENPSGSSELPLQEPETEILFIHGGSIHLGNQAGGVVEALLIENGRVVAGGPEKLLRQRLPETGYGQIDLKGAIAVPGLQDAHGHLERLGASLEQLDLSGCANYQELVQLVAKTAEGLPKGRWIIGRGWDEIAWGQAEFPNHAELTAAVPEHPVLLQRAGGHAVLVNRRALAFAELDKRLELPPRIAGGRLLLDKDQRATGILLDNAIDLVRRFVPKPEEATREAWILAGQEHVLSQGITCVHEMGVDPATVRIYENLRGRGLLSVRVVAYLDGNPGISTDVLKTFPRSADGMGQFSVPGIYFRLDGDLATRGAALIEDYSDAKGERGHLLITEDRLTRLVHEAWQQGIQPAIGAHGDRANMVALGVYERMLQVDETFSRLRPRIEHAQVISSRDIPRFPKLRIVPSMQPVCSLSNDSWLLSRLGQNRARGAFAWRSLAPGWMQLAFGSSFPDENASPLMGLFAARTRRDAEALATDDFLVSERLDGSGVLAGYTRGAAYAVHQEKLRGQLLPGYWADLTVFDLDPVLAQPEELPNGHVLLTVINGRVAYQR